MEQQYPHQSLDCSSTVDTSRPFTSVKEAVAIFGERLLLGDVYSPKPFIADDLVLAAPPKRENSWRFSTPSPTMKSKEEDHAFSETLKKLEAELEETKVELKLLKERESETEVALATLNAELHKNMSKLAQAEALEAGKAAGATKTVRFEERSENGGGIREEEKKKEKIIRRAESQSLAQILSLGEQDESYLGGKSRERKKRMKKKKKPIIPLVWDLFSRKKGSATNHHNPLFASPYFYN